MAAPHNSAATAGNASSLEFAHTLFAGADRIVATVALDADRTVSSIIWDDDGVNQSFVAVTGTTQDNAGAGHVAIWELDSPLAATGSGNITATFDDKGQNIIGVLDWTDTLTADRGAGSVPDAVTSVSETISADNADFIMDAFRSPGNAPTIGGDQNTIYNVAAGGERGASSFQAGAFDDVMSWSWSGASDVAHSACRIPNGAVLAPPHPHRFNYQPYLAQ